MPSLANNSKATENKASDGPAETPFNQMLTIVEHKIRNLEKRKTKLDGYRDLEKKGEKLTTEQKHACKKYEEVIHSLDLAKELNKQFAQLAKEANREAKRESKRNAFLKTQQESAKIREVLVIQDILRSLADDAVRQDFLDGTNGAVKIEQSDMDLLEKLYVEVTPKRPTRSDEPTFTQSATHSANTFSSVIDARAKVFGDSTYEHVKETLQSIQNCGYFEKEIVQVEETKPENEDETETEAVDDEKTSEIDVNPDSVEAPGANAVPKPEELIMHMQQAAAVASNPVAPAIAVPVAPVPVMPVTTVRAVEQNYYKQYMQQAPQPTLRPIHEVIGTGNFHFLQDSELDSSDMIMTTAPFPQVLPTPIAQKLPPTAGGVISGIPAASPVVNSVPQRENPVTPLQQTPVNVLSSLAQAQTSPPQPTTFPGNAFPAMQTPQQPAPTMFSANVLSKDQPHIPPFANSPQIPMQVVNSQIPGFAMNAQATPTNAMAQIAQLQNMIQQQQQLSGSIKVNPAKDLVNTDDLTEKLKSTLHINDNAAPKNAENLLKSAQSPLTNTESQDWNDVNNDANSWSNQMAEENSRNNVGDRFKRGNNNIGGMFRASSDKYGGNGNSYRPRNTYQNGGNRMNSNNGGENSSNSVFFRNNDRYYSQQNGNNKDSYGGKSSAGNGNLGYNSKPSRTDGMMNNRPPRMQAAAGNNEYRSRTGGANGRDNRGGLKA
ncbi:caprin homolog [Culicoides brevitarsis]|uniref:caprin homolog n=1 Tax=Culicoides brevitarsis TaxID=469753 RepID=UPI00307B44CD